MKATQLSLPLQLGGFLNLDVRRVPGAKVSKIRLEAAKPLIPTNSRPVRFAGLWRDFPIVPATH
jgi:hypothetical protein